MSTKVKKWFRRAFPTELKHAIDYVLDKYDRKDEDESELIDELYDELCIRKKFERIVNYNTSVDGEDGFRIKRTFVNNDYDSQLSDLKFLIHSNNGTYDRVVKRVKEYHDNLINNSRMAKTLSNVREFRREVLNPYLKKVS